MVVQRLCDDPEPMIKGPLSLIAVKICPQCNDWIESGETVFLLEEEGMLDDYVHAGCLYAWIHTFPDQEGP
jgi:hypothetical protein